MKNLFLYVVLMTITLSSFAQGAGNWAFQSKTNSFSNTESSFGGNGGLSDYEVNSSYYQPNYYGANDTVIYIQVKALMNVMPDTYILILGLSQISDKLETCFELIDQRIEAFIHEGQINSDDIYVDFISQTPIFAREREKKIFSKKYVEVPKGFEIKKNIHIRFTDSEAADKYLKIAAKNEIYDIIRVDYIVNNHRAVYDSIRQECIKLVNMQVGDYKRMGLGFEADYTSMET
ncbi:MAG: SIMPL domain-containing protein, partial [Bacteroidales bacterium]|nr:SIMPL domain-containing protein [Bacteroidales bacterium]